MWQENNMEEQKRSVGINITKHVRKFINYQGDEITREEALGISKPSVNTGADGNGEGDKGEENKEEAK